MKKISVIFSEVAQKKISVSILINALTANEGCEGLEQSRRFAFQAFCCAILAKEAKGLMQKAQYIREYWEFIQQSLQISPESVEGHLVRLMVEKQLENVNFVSHVQEDSNFLLGIVSNIQDIAIKELIEKVL
mgnify:CR=1 FL=1